MKETINPKKYIRDGSLIWKIGYIIFSVGFWMMFTEAERKEIKDMLLEAVDLFEEKAAEDLRC